MPRPLPETKLVDGNIHKQCSKCNEFKPLPEFGYRATGYLGTNSWCRICNNKSGLAYYHATKTPEKAERVREYSKQYYQENKDKYREYQLKNKFDLTKEEFDELARNGCQVCGGYEKLCVDHHHQTNEVRGILCHKCNAALGLLDEDSTRILKLAAYIEEWINSHAI